MLSSEEMIEILQSLNTDVHDVNAYYTPFPYLLVYDPVPSHMISLQARMKSPLVA